MPATIDRCPRCLSSFHCGLADAEGCACTTISLSEQLLGELRRTFRGCLCLRCLNELSVHPLQDLPLSEVFPAPTQIDPPAAPADPSPKE